MNRASFEMDEICWNCKWWAKKLWMEDLGESKDLRCCSCLRHSPIAVEHNIKNQYPKVLAKWPITYGSQRCGDWELETAG